MPEDDDTLFRRRMEPAGAACPASALSLPPDADPQVPAPPCDPPPDAPDAVFLPPNLPPPSAGAGESLPGPLQVFSQEAEATCVDPEDADLVLVGGAYNDVPGARYVVDAGYDVRQVFVDDIGAIPIAEVYRLAGKIGAMQDYVDDNFLAAYNAADYTAFDAGFAEAAGTTAAVAALIRAALAAQQAIADAVASNLASASIECGYRNRQLWVTCLDEAPGYEIHYEDPGAEVQAVISAGLFVSHESQEAADALAAQSAAFGLECLVPNDEQDVSCSDAGLLDESTEIEWPSDWTFNPAPTSVARPVPG